MHAVELAVGLDERAIAAPGVHRNPQRLGSPAAREAVGEPRLAVLALQPKLAAGAQLRRRDGQVAGQGGECKG